MAVITPGKARPRVNTTNLAIALFAMFVLGLAVGMKLAAMALTP